jgi:hypothetical protein
MGLLLPYPSRPQWRIVATTGGKPMNPDEGKSSEPTLQELVQRYREQKHKGSQLVRALFRQAVGREPEPGPQEPAVIEPMSGLRQEQGRVVSLPRDERPTVHYTALPAGSPDSLIAREWSFYRRAAGQLLAEGHEDQWVLIRDESIIGIWDTQEEAEAVASYRYPSEPGLIHQIQRYEQVLRGPSRFRQCPG